MSLRFRVGAGVGPLAALLCLAANAETPQRVTSVVRADRRTGKLVRSIAVSSRPIVARQVAETVIAPRAVSPSAPTQETETNAAGFDETVEAIASRQALPAQLLHSVIKVESNYNPLAVSPKGALGLMQLIPATARRFGVADVFNPVDNMNGGARYLRYLLDRFGGNYPLALAAYNAGEAAVERYGGIPPYPETVNYVLSVGRRLAEANRTKGPARVPGSEKKSVETKPVGPAHIQEIVEPDGTVRYISR
jgi:soluble lytic murein transglycosylase-like protein